MARKRILVLTNQPQQRLLEGVDPLVEELRQHGDVVDIADATLCDALPAEAADIAVVFGGDGTFLGAARRLAMSRIPLVGVNMGRLGFLTEFSVEEFRHQLPAILDGRLPTLPRMMLQVDICRNGKPCFSSPAMNEVSIVAGEPFRMIELSVQSNGTHVCTFMGDGLILATPTGSTGYTLSAGGPILEPSMDAIAVTPVAAHSLSIRPIVMNADHTVTVVPLQANPGTSASIDGQVRSQLAQGDVIEVSRSQHSLSVVRNPQWPFYRRLSTKLQWGRSPHHSSR